MKRITLRARSVFIAMKYAYNTALFAHAIAIYTYVGRAPLSGPSI